MTGESKNPYSVRTSESDELNDTKEPDADKLRPSRINNDASSGTRRYTGISRVWAALMFTVIAVCCGIGSYLSLPARSEAIAPPLTTFLAISTVRMEQFSYEVRQATPSTADVSVTAQLEQGVHTPIAANAVQIYLYLPFGTTFGGCPPGSSCHSGSTWKDYPTFEQNMHFNRYGIAFTGVIRIHTPGLAYAANGVTAWAAIPQAQYSGPHGTGTAFFASYDIPSADSYDWSSFPTTTVTKNQGGWEEILTSGGNGAPAREVVGLDHAEQDVDSNRVFFAGALVGIAGAALLAAIQEAVRSRD